MMLPQDMNWPVLVGLFLTSLLIVLAWLVQYSRALLRLRSPKPDTQPRGSRSWQLPFSLSHQTQAGGVWGSLLKLRFGRDGRTASEAGVKGLLISLFSFKSFRENWQKAWIRALNQQATRHGSSIQITFDNSLQLPSSATIDSVTCAEQSENSMVLQCNFALDTVTFPVTVTQQSPAAVSMDTYQITIEPMLAQLLVRLEEVEEEGLLVSWTFSRQPSFFLTVCPRKIQREKKEREADLEMIGELVEDALFSTQPAMMVNLKACISSPVFPREHLQGGLNSPSQSVSPHTPRLLLRQLKATCLQAGQSPGDLCCVFNIDHPSSQKRTRFLTRLLSPKSTLDWSEEITLDLATETKELRVRLLERNSKGEQFLPGHGFLSLDFPRRAPTGQHVLSISQGHGLAPVATVTFELLYLEVGDPHGSHLAVPLRSSLTPTKKVDVDRTVMPDGTIVTTVTTIQSRPKLNSKLGDSPSRSPSKVEVTDKSLSIPSDSRTSSSRSPSLDSPLSNGLDPVADTAIRQLTESASKVARKTPTKRSTLIISGVSKVPFSEDDSALSVGYAAAMDAALQGGGLSNHCVAGQPRDPEETTPSDVSERPSVDDVESETGSTGALETRSLKDHKVGFLRSGTKLLFRRRHRQKDPGCSQSHEDVSSLDNSATPGGTIDRKKSGSFSRRLIKRFSFRSSSFRSSSKSKDKASATNGGTSAAEH